VGDGGVDQSPTDINKTFSDWADELCPYYMAIGVPCDEYWHGDPTQLQYYIKAHELRNEQRNEEMWWQGLYFHDAVSVVLANAFKKPGQRPEKYHEKPIRIKPLTEEEKKQKELRQAKSVINEFDAWGDKLNAQKQ
jgi:hypothetical protein